MRFEKSGIKSALAELWSTTCCLETVLLALFHTRVAGEKPGLFEDGAHLFAVLEQRTGDAVADGTGLTGNAAARDGTHDVELAEGVCKVERLADDQFEGLEAEVIVDITTVDGDRTGTGIEPHAGNGLFPPAGTVKIRSAFVHND